MKILLVNKYFYIKGGAETYFFEVAKLLMEKGHQIQFFSMEHPQNIDTEFKKYFISEVNYQQSGLRNVIKSSIRMLYSLEAQKMISLLVADKPNIVHLNNIYHQISPSIIKTIKKNSIPSVMTLHDLKMVCGSYAMLADNRICEACKKGKYYYCFLKSCFKNSRMKSLLATMEMYLHHRILKIYQQIDIFISPSKFLKLKLEEMGFKATIVHLPNFISAGDFNPQYNWPERSIVYVGRLSKDKGIMTLIDAIKKIKDISLKIIGSGPFKDELTRKVKREQINQVRFLGFKAGKELKNEIRNSMFVVVPSELYENCPMTVLESFAMGKPVIGSRIGGIPELVKDKTTGLTFEAGNQNDLAEKIQKLLKDSEAIKCMGRAARALVENEYNAEKYYKKLIEIYQMVLAERIIK